MVATKFQEIRNRWANPDLPHIFDAMAENPIARDAWADLTIQDAIASIAWLANEIEFLLNLLQIDRDLHDLWLQQAEWSDKTFGPPNWRGPLGALRHLAHEAREAEENPGDITHLRGREALRFQPGRLEDQAIRILTAAAHAKLEVNKRRNWPPPKPGDDPVFHIQGVDLASGKDYTRRLRRFR